MQLELPFTKEGIVEPPGPSAAMESPAGGLLSCRSQTLEPVTERSVTEQRADALHQVLRDATGVDFRLRITNNSSTMISLRYERQGGHPIVSLHHMFLEAPEAVRKALGKWIMRPRAKVAGEVLEAFIAEQRHLIVSRRPRASSLRTEGRFFDLRLLYEGVNREEFAEEVNTPITWGRMPTLRRRRSIRFGSFSPTDDLIRIHPYLDQDFVPTYFIRYIVFHEMLHAHMGIEESATGRRLIHPPKFRKREECYAEYDKAVAWMNDETNLRRLLRSPKK
tara:strand:+ start:346 stop:1179 length:834 start_codon:yes stop_codon:yes gene_type:complete